MFYSFKGLKPIVHSGAFVHPQAAVTGDVIIEDEVYIGPGCALRGDFGRIIIRRGSNVQENCTIHMFPGVTVELMEESHIGHGAIIHGARIGKNSLVGMNAVVMDDVIVGDGCIVGALCFVPAGMIIPDRKVVVGNPAKIIKDVSDEMLKWKSEGTAIYRHLASEDAKSILPCDPLQQEELGRVSISSFYEPWKSRKNE